MTTVLNRRDALTRLAACLLCACTGATVAAQAPNALVMERVTIRDAAAVHQDAVSFLKPRGWKVQGGIKWYPNSTHQACLEMRVSNPEGLEQIETLPWTHCNWITNPVVPLPRGSIYLGNLVEPPIEDPREVIRRLTLPQLRPGAVITGYRELPEVAKALSAQHGGARVRAGRTRIEYTVGGQQVEEDFYLAIYVTAANLGGGTMSYLWGPAWPPFSLRAAKGQLDAKTGLMLAAVQSAQLHHGWFAEYQYVCNLFQKRLAGEIHDVRVISETIRRNSEQIRQMYSDAYWQRQASQDRVHQQFSDHIRGVQRWTSPHERYPVQLPSGYRNAWVSAQGYYVLSNEDGYNPNVGSTVTWQRMQEAR